MSATNEHASVEEVNPWLDQLMGSIDASTDRSLAAAELQSLQNLSDAELDRAGLRRDTILDFVLERMGARAQAA